MGTVIIVTILILGNVFFPLTFLDDNHIFNRLNLLGKGVFLLLFGWFLAILVGMMLAIEMADSLIRKVTLKRKYCSYCRNYHR